MNIQEAMKTIKESGLSVEELINIENNEPTMEVDSYGNKCWYLNDKPHRVDGPAIEYANGNKFWYLNGEFHRVDGPAIEFFCGDKYWYLNGKFQFRIYKNGTFEMGE